jgi:pyruvate dehydrogenase kinase 2/3/4
MVDFGGRPSDGTLFKATQFLREELPIRLAHRVVELDTLPWDLSHMPSVRKVRDWYAESFADLTEFPKMAIPAELKVRERVNLSIQMVDHKKDEFPSVNFNGSVPNTIAGHRYFTPIDAEVMISSDARNYVQEFVRVIENIKKRHDPVVTTVAQGIRELKAQEGLPVIDERVQAFLDRFYMSRIGIRMLIGQHVALNRMATGGGASDYVGIICTKTNVAQIAQDAIDNARYICEDHYALFAAPPIQLYCPPNLDFMYVPSHLHHMLFELLKNCLRAVVERYGPDADHFPPIKIIVAEGKEDITIKISDEGGGIPRSGIPLIWTYLYTTASPGQDVLAHANANETTPMSDFKAPMAGFGYGLPLSRLYARYFGGDLRLISMEGYGTDAYLHLSRLSDSEEPLP